MSRAPTRARLCASLPILAALSLAACDSPLRPQSAPEAGAAEASPRSAVQAAPPVNLDDSYASYSYLIEGSGPDSFSEIVPHASLPSWERPPPLSLGAWTIDVTVRDSGSATVGRGSGSAALAGGALTVPVTVSAAGGSGTLTLDLSWTPGELSFSAARQFELILEPRPSGAAVDLSSAPGLSIDWLTGSVNLAGHPLDSGSYLMRMGIVVDGARVWGTAKSLLILPGSATFDATGIPPGAFNAPPFAYPSVLGGAFVPGATIKLRGGGPGTIVRYTTDGGDPAAGGLYTSDSDIALSDNMTLRTYAANAFGSQTGAWYFVESAGGLYVNDIDGDDSYPGTNAGPKKTLQAAVAAANGMGGAASVTIHVAGETAGSGGTYDVPAGLTIRRPMELLGGYDPLDGSWLSRDINAYPTTIKRTMASGEIADPDVPIAVLRFPETLAGPAFIEGFTIRNQVPTVDYTAAVVVAASGTVTFLNNSIRNECNNTLSIGILIRDSKPVIEASSLIEGGSGLESVGVLVTGPGSEPTIENVASIHAAGSNVPGSKSAGIVFRDGARGTVESSAVSGGQAERSYGIVSRLGANPTIRASTVSGGGAAGSTTRSAGIAVLEAGAVIANNHNYPDGILGGYGSELSAGILVESSPSSLLIQDNGNISGGQSTAAGRSVGVIFESGVAPAQGIVKGNVGIRGGDAGEATGIWVRGDSKPIIQQNSLIEAGGGVLTATARGIHVEGFPGAPAEPTIADNQTIRGGDAHLSAGIDVEYSGGSFIVQGNADILGGGAAGGAGSSGIRFLHSSPSSTGDVVGNPNISGGVGAESHGIMANNAVPNISGNVIKGGSGGKAYGLRLLFNSDLYADGNVISGRAGGAGETYGLFINGASPTVTHTNAVSSGDSFGGSAAYGIYVVSQYAAYPSAPIIGGPGGELSVQAGGPNTTGKTYGLAVEVTIPEPSQVTPPYATGTYTRLNVVGRVAGTPMGPSNGAYIAGDARPVIRDSTIRSGDASGSYTLIGIEAIGVKGPGFTLERSNVSGGYTLGGGLVRSYGLKLENVSHARIRRNKIYGGDSPVASAVAGVYILAQTRVADGVVLTNNAIMGSGSANANHGILTSAQLTGVPSFPKFYNNTVFGGGTTNSGFSAEALSPGSRSANDVVNNIIFSTGVGGNGYVERAAGGGITDPNRLQNNALFGASAAYDNRGTPISLPALLNDGSTIFDQTGYFGTSSGNAVIDPTAAFSGGILPTDGASFSSYDWRLIYNIIYFALLQGGLDLTGNPNLEPEDFIDLYGAPRTVFYSMGAAEY